MIKKGHIELSIAGKHPTVVLLGLLDLKIPQQIARFRDARFQRPVQHADENNIATDCRRRKHVRSSLLAHDWLGAVCVNNVEQTGARFSKKHFPVGYWWVVIYQLGSVNTLPVDNRR